MGSERGITCPVVLGAHTISVAGNIRTAHKRADSAAMHRMCTVVHDLFNRR